MPTAAAGIAVIGVDSWAGMLQVWRRHARAAGVEELLDLRLGDLASPPVSERVGLRPLSVKHQAGGLLRWPDMQVSSPPTAVAQKRLQSGSWAISVGSISGTLFFSCRNRLEALYTSFLRRLIDPSGRWSASERHELKDSTSSA